MPHANRLCMPRVGPPLEQQGSEPLFSYNLWSALGTNTARNKHGLEIRKPPRAGMGSVSGKLTGGGCTCMPNREVRGMHPRQTKAGLLRRPRSVYRFFTSEISHQIDAEAHHHLISLNTDSPHSRASDPADALTQSVNRSKLEGFG